MSALAEIAPRLARAYEAERLRVEGCPQCKHPAHGPHECSRTVQGGSGYFGYVPVLCRCAHDGGIGIEREADHAA